MRRIGYLVAGALLAAPACKGPAEHDHPRGAVSAEPTATARQAPARAGLRPPKPKTRATAPPPNLPRLATQAPPSSAPPPRQKGKPVLEEYPCGSVWTGEEEVALECDQPIDERRFGTPAVALVPYELLRAPKGDLPATVDHRLDGFEGRVRRQAGVGACTAFSLASQIDHAIGLWTGQPGDVSVMEVWARYHQARGPSAIAANIGKSVARESDWPYDAAVARAWQRCKRDGSCLSDEEQAHLQDVDRRGIVVLEQVERLPSDETLLDVVQAKLAAGRDVGTGGVLPKPFRPVGEPGSRYVPETKEKGKGGHAFSLVGYTHVDGERYFLIKNSWGERWGDGGYAWIHEHTLRGIAHSGYVAIVDPAAGVGLRRHRRNQAQVAACPAGEAPDSVDGACQPLCPDQGPPHGGFCGVTEDCTRGYVNVAGECVLAAPTAKGTEPVRGIAFACAPSGCVYTIPRGVEGCGDPGCQKSCPAPDFRLGKGKGGLLCLE